MGYPVNQMGQGDELLQLFPIPVMICPYPMDYSKELEWIRNCETRKENKGEMVVWITWIYTLQSSIRRYICFR